MSADRIAELESQIASLVKRVDEAEQRADVEKQVRLREAEARKDAQVFAAHVQLELEELKREVTELQTLSAYLQQTSRLQLHLSRLLPLLPDTVQTSQTPASVSQSKSSPKTTTAGQTSIYKKVYPLRLRPWSEFEHEQKAAFSYLQSRLGQAKRFPPRRDVQAAEAILQDTIPVRFLNTEKFHGHERTGSFLDIAIEKPSSKVLSQYFAATNQDTVVYFDNLTIGVRRLSHSTTVGEDSETGPATSSNASGSPAPEWPAKIQPDCVVLARDGWADRTKPEPDLRRLVVGEYKPCHSLRAAELQSMPPLSEDCLIRMAMASQHRKASKKQHLRTAKAPSSPNTLPAMSAKQTFFACALAQIFHFMTMSGLEFGYLTTGETITFLRIPYSEPTTLLYHTSAFPAIDPKDLPQAGGAPVYPSDLTSSAAPSQDQFPDNDSLAALAISQLCSLCYLAINAPVRPPIWVAEALQSLAPFPGLPPGRRQASPSPLGPRRHEQGLPGPDAASDDRSRSSAATLTAERPYCTQMCLLGLTGGLPLDAACPNYALHKDAIPENTVSSCNRSKVKIPHHQGHAICQDDVVRLVQDQIAISPENNCRLLYKEGLYGAIGCLLKITLNGYGYTFVAKAVESWNRRRLQKESRIYTLLYRQQGVLIPVHLGLVKLRSPYPFMARFTMLSHFMLLSYVGEALHHGPSLDVLGQKLSRDLDQEITNTYQALLDWGLHDLDTDVYNATWCEETQRVVKIDFDHCYLNMDVYTAKARAEDSTARKTAENAASEAEVQAQKLKTKLERVDDVHVGFEIEWEPMAKRIKYAEAKSE